MQFTINFHVLGIPTIIFICVKFTKGFKLNNSIELTEQFTEIEIYRPTFILIFVILIKIPGHKSERSLSFNNSF